MKRLIVGFVIGLMLGSAGAATASGLVYWKRGGGSYVCTGIYTGVNCAERRWRGLYGVSITPSYLVVTRGDTVVVGCHRGFGPARRVCFGP